MMLDEFLSVAYKAETRKQAEFELVGLLKDIPTMELRKLASGVSVKELYGRFDKTAYGNPPSSSGDRVGGFLDHFRGTALFDQAIALEQEELQAEMLDQQKREERTMQMRDDQSLWDAKDRIRIKKRLLELELAKQEAGEPSAPAQGAGAPGDVPAEGVQDNSQGLMGGVAKSAAGASMGMQPRPKALAMPMKPPPPPPAGLQPKPKVASPLAGISPEKLAFADALGRELARADMEKAAHAAVLETCGGRAGAAMAKVALNVGMLQGAAKGLGGAMLGWAKKNPLQAATTIGGAAMGAMNGAKNGGGLGGAVTGAVGGGAMGNMAGRGIQGFQANRAAGQSVGQALGNVGMNAIQKGVGALTG